MPHPINQHLTHVLSNVNKAIWRHLAATATHKYILPLKSTKTSILTLHQPDKTYFRLKRC